MGKLLSQRTRVVVGLFIVAVAAAPAMGQYNAGFTWNRYDDWKRGTSDGSPAGNPCKDSAGKAVWSSEYIDDVPADSGLDTNRPWYKLPSSGLMVWDSHWVAGTWAKKYDLPPVIYSQGIAHIANNESYRGDHYAVVPLLRWRNPSAAPLKVSLTSGDGFLAWLKAGMPTGTLADVVIARTDASDDDSVHPLYTRTVVKTGGLWHSQYVSLPALNIQDLALDPGDSIIFSIRSRTKVTGYRWYNVQLLDNVTITVTSSRQPERREHRRLADQHPEAGFTWNRWKDWKPGTSNGCSAGNPCKDSAGRAVWSAEYILEVPPDRGLDTDHPWYLLPSSGLMVWDSHWSGGTWARQYDLPPMTLRSCLGHIPTDKSYRGDHYANVPLVRWKNPSGTPLTVSLASGSDFLCKLDIGMPTGTVADVVIARTDASDDNSVHVLYRQTVVKTRAASLREMQALPALAIDNLVLDPGDEILFSIRSRTRTTGFTWSNVAFHDDVTITVKSSGQPERRVRRRLADQHREAGFTWNRWKDWKPGTSDGKSAGNPCADSTGRGVWSYEYISKAPCGSGLDSESPWYKLPSSGLMVWDGHTGSGGVWGYRYDNAPFVFPGPAGLGHVPNNDSYRGDHFAVVPLVRWKNPSSVPMKVSLTSGPGFQGRIHYWPPGTTVDLVIARTDASDGGSVHLLYSQTIVKRLAQGQHEYFALPALNIERLALDPGDDILFSVRARNATTGFTWYSAMFNDDVTITVLP